MTALGAWANFFVIVGSAAGALIGLQFVVMTLINNIPIPQGSVPAANTYTTPTVVHFGVVLLLSAIVSAPWEALETVTSVWGLLGVIGTAYIVVVAWRLRSQTVYQAVFEDWLFHVLLPFTAYSMLVVSACAVYMNARSALFVLGAAALLLLFIGIHNAWDLVTYHVFVKRPEQQEAERDEAREDLR
jgi:hypothetical protein